MIVQNLIDAITVDTNDLPDSDSETIQYINYAIDYLSFLLCNLEDVDMIVRASIDNDSIKPSNFIRFAPRNSYPIYSVGDKFYTYSGETVPDCRYFATKGHVSQLTDQIPFSDSFESALCFIVSKMIKGKSNFPKDITAGADENTADLMTLIKMARSNGA